MQQKTSQVRQLIGDNIRVYRQQLELTQAQLAEKTELSIQSLSKLENGLQFSRMDTYCRVAEALLVPLHSLFIAPELQIDNLVNKYSALFFDCDEGEKRALLNILIEIKSLIRAIPHVQGRNP